MESQYISVKINENIRHHNQIFKQLKSENRNHHNNYTIYHTRNQFVNTTFHNVVWLAAYSFQVFTFGRNIL